MKLGYGTNGFTNHRIAEAIEVIAGTGYEGIALTFDHPHLAPFETDLPRRTADLRRRLERHDLDVVVETGARYVLDPWRKHHPTLVSEGGSSRRVGYLCRAVEVAAGLGAPVVSFWSGVLPPGLPAETGWARLERGVSTVLDCAERHGVQLAIEPEPGHLVDTVDAALELRRRLGDPERLRLTLDLGHVICNEPRDLPETIALVGPLLANVQVDDMVRDVHEHLELGQGQVDFVAALGALEDVGYDGLAALELPRQAHDAPAVAERSLTFLRRALERSRQSERAS